MIFSHYIDDPLASDQREPRIGNRIIKSNVIHLRSGFKAHDFPQLPLSGDLIEERFLSSREDFQPSTFNADSAFGRMTETALEPLTKMGSTVETDEVAVTEIDAAIGQVGNILNRIQQSIAEMEQASEKMEQGMENFAALLALRVAESLVKNEIQHNGQTVLTIVPKALERAKGNDILSIRLNPDDIETIRSSKQILPGVIGNTETIKLEADAGITRGGCIIETLSGDIDARIESRFQTIQEAIQSIVDNPPNKGGIMAEKKLGVK